MANNPLSAKSKTAGCGASMRITPSNSPALRPSIRSPQKSTYQSNLSLQTVIGTTIVTPNGFSVHEQSKSFALCAGSTVVLAELDDGDKIGYRFFRARPSAISVNHVTPFYNSNAAPATPDPRTRPLSTIKSNANGNVQNGSPTSDWADSINSRPWSSRERIKAVTCVSISPNGRFLAFGETGYNPRVLIFSTAKDSPPDVPLTILSEHKFGVRSLAFSSDSQYLATLGDVNDGFLFVWAVNLRNGLARLHCTNKCTSFIRGMCWMGQTLITAGVRHVKVWRLPDVRSGSPSSKSRPNSDLSVSSANMAPKTLLGRNCLLGSLGDHTFTCVASISDSEAVVGTDTGAVCLVDDSDGWPKLSLVKSVDFGINSIAVDSEQESVWLGGRGGRMCRLTFEFLRTSAASAPSSPGFTGKVSADHKCKEPSITTMGFLSGRLITLDTARTTHIYPIENLSDDGQRRHAETSLPAHKDAVLGISPLRTPNELGAEFFTWSSGGTVNFWDTEGRCHGSQEVDLEQLPCSDDDIPNELKIVRTSESMDFFISGDRFGVLRMLSGQPWKCIQGVRAHGGEITDIAIQQSSHDDSFLIASSGRDRMVQLFKKSDENFELIQTMEDHVGAVGQLLFINDGEKLLSCSADRTIIVRDRVIREVDGTSAIAYVISKVITLKSSPVSMTLMPDDSDTLVFSTVDRCIQKYDLYSGRHIHSFRASDHETSDAVVMSSLTVASGIPGQSPKLLVGVSSTDKSVRVYDFERESLLTGEFGHTEGVSALLFLENRPAGLENTTKRSLVSAGKDGVVMIWNLSVQPQHAQEPPQVNPRDDEGTPAKALTVAKPPLRRVLSKSELASLQRPDNSTASPTPVRESPLLLRRKVSRQTLVSSSLRSGNGTSATPSPPVPSRRSSVSSTSVERARRSSSPLSPKTIAAKKLGGANHNSHRSPSDLRNRTRNPGKSEHGSLNVSTEQVCRALRTYRKKLNMSTEKIHSAKELERELALTLRILSARVNGPEETPETTETDSSGKENERMAISPSVPANKNNKTRRMPRRIPSTPNLSKTGPRKFPRSLSVGRNGCV